VDDAHDIFSGGGPVCVVAGEFGVRVPCEVVYMSVEVSGDCHFRDAENLGEQDECVKRGLLQQRIQRHDFGTHLRTGRGGGVRAWSLRNILAECLDVRGGERKEFRGDNLRECGDVVGHARRDAALYIMCVLRVTF
jgi:hypothetical protein